MAKDCNNCKFELYSPDEIPCKDCGMDDREYWIPKPQTNADRIRAMSDEELADVLAENLECDYCPIDYCDGCTKNRCRAILLEWLKQPAEVSGG